MNFENDIKDPKRRQEESESTRKAETNCFEFHKPHKLTQMKHEPF